MPAYPWEKLERIGRGSFGDVYKGIHVTTGKLVAIKVVNLEADDEGIEEMRREISILSHCQSAYITKYHGSIVHGTKLWIIMDYCALGSLRNIIKLSHGIPEHILVLIAREMAVGLDYLHKNQIIHRDIKAANILVTDSGSLKYCDFGVSGLLIANARRNSFVGTPYWMAPEVIRRSEYDYKADIWSYGITLIELALGNPPHAELDPVKAIHMITKSPPPTLEPSDTRFSKQFREFLAFVLHDDPEKRPTTEAILKHKFLKLKTSVKKSMKELTVWLTSWKEELATLKLSPPRANRQNMDDTLSKDVQSRRQVSMAPSTWLFDDDEQGTSETLEKPLPRQKHKVSIANPSISFIDSVSSKGEFIDEDLEEQTNFLSRLDLSSGGSCDSESSTSSMERIAYNRSVSPLQALEVEETGFSSLDPSPFKQPHKDSPASKASDPASHSTHSTPHSEHSMVPAPQPVHSPSPLNPLSCPSTYRQNVSTLRRKKTMQQSIHVPNEHFSNTTCDSIFDPLDLTVPEFPDPNNEQEVSEFVDRQLQSHFDLLIKGWSKVQSISSLCMEQLKHDS